MSIYGGLIWVNGKHKYFPMWLVYEKQNKAKFEYYFKIGNGRSCLAVLIQSPNSEEGQVGWVITRTLHAWQHFYLRLKDVCSN